MIVHRPARGRLPGAPLLRERVLGVLRNAYEPMTRLDIAGRVDATPDGVCKVLRELAAEGLAINLEGPGRPAAWVAL